MSGLWNRGRVTVLVLVALIILMITGCGGGGGGFDPAPTPKPPTPAPSQEPVNAVDVEPFQVLERGPENTPLTLQLTTQGSYKAGEDFIGQGFMAPWVENLKKYVHQEITTVQVGDEARASSQMGCLPDGRIVSAADTLNSTALSTGGTEPTGFIVKMLTVGDSKTASGIDKAITYTGYVLGDTVVGVPDEVKDVIRDWMARRQSEEDARQTSGAQDPIKRLLALDAYHKGRPLVKVLVDSGDGGGAWKFTVPTDACDGDQLILVGAVSDRDAKWWFAQLNPGTPTTQPPTDHEIKDPKEPKPRKKKGWLIAGALIVASFIPASALWGCPSNQQSQQAEGDCPPDHHVEARLEVECEDANHDHIVFEGEMIQFHVDTNAPVVKVGFPDGTFQNKVNSSGIGFDFEDMVDEVTADTTHTWTFAAGLLTDSCTFQVKNAVVPQVQIRPRNLVDEEALDLGDQVRFEAVNCHHTATWSVSGGGTLSDPGTSVDGWPTILLTATTAGGPFTISVTCGENGSDSTTFEVNPPVQVNQPPVISMFHCMVSATESLSVDFTVTATDSDGTIVDYFYEFGDTGSLSTLHTTDSTVSHTYAIAGTYNVKVTVTDNDGATDTDTCLVTVTSGGGGTDPFAGITAQIRPNDLDSRTLDMSEGEEHQLNLMLLTSTGSEFTPPSGSTYQWWWDSNDGAQAMELEITNGGKNLRVYGALSTEGTHTLRGRVTNGSHFREHQIDIVIAP